jgi:polysaccharide export outer membrane protein
MKQKGRWIFPLLLFSIAVGVVGCSSPREYQLFQQEERNRTLSKGVEKWKVEGYSYQYKILPGDLLKVTIYTQWGRLGNGDKKGESGIENSTIEVKVYKNGEIFLPLIGKVKVAGIGEEEATAKIEKLYQKYIRRPYVRVEDTSKKVYVLGEVKKPGVVPLKKDFTNLIEVISREEGFTDKARRDNILIISREGEHLVVKRVDLTRLSALTSKNIFLKPYDIVYVPPVNSKPFNLQIGGVQPFINFINSILSTFVNVKVLTQ